MVSTPRFFPISRAASCALMVFLSGCAVEQALLTQGDPASQGDPSISPAREQVRPGRAEIVLTDRRWSSFEEASEHRITAVVDGSPLYLNVRAPGPLGQLALPAEPEGRYAFSPYPHFYLHIGDDTSLRSLNTCYITLSPQEAAGRELVVPLAPLATRPGGNPADCWLAAATSSNRGTRNYEIRLAGLAGRQQDWLPVADLLAVETIRAEYSGGTPQYAAMLAAAPDVTAPQAAVAPAMSPQQPAPQSAVAEPTASQTTPPRPIAPPVVAPPAVAPAAIAPAPVALSTLAPPTLAPSTFAPPAVTPPAAPPQAVAPPTPGPSTSAPATSAPPTVAPPTVAPQSRPPDPVPPEAQRTTADVGPGSMLVPPRNDERSTPVPAAAVMVTPVADPTVAAVQAPPRETLPYRSQPGLEAQGPERERQGVSQTPARIVIHSPAGDVAADARARALRTRLVANGGFYVELRYVTARVPADDIRIFFEGDRERAVSTRDLVADAGVPIRNFSDQRPLPRPGTIELWLASTRTDPGTGWSGSMRPQ